MILGDFTRQANNSSPLLSINMCYDAVVVWALTGIWKCCRSDAVRLPSILLCESDRGWSPLASVCTFRESGFLAERILNVTQDAPGVHHVVTAFFFLILGKCDQVWPRIVAVWSQFLSHPVASAPLSLSWRRCLFLFRPFLRFTTCGRMFFFAQKSICLPLLHTASPYSFH